MTRAKKKLTAKQMAIARVAKPRGKITGKDFAMLKKNKKRVTVWCANIVVEVVAVVEANGFS